MKKVRLLLIAIIGLMIPLVVQAKDIEVKYKKIFEFNRPTGYDSIQGMIITDKYFVIAAVTNDGSKTALLVFDKYTYEYAEIGENPIVTYNFGHANDMAYSEKNDEIYIIDGKHIYVLDATNFKQKDTIDLEKEYMAIEVDDNYFYLRDNNNIDTYAKNLELLDSIDVKTNYAKQGIAKKNQYFYYSQYVALSDETWASGTNVIKVYDEAGVLASTLYNNEKLGELEAMEFDNEEPYLLFQSPSIDGAIYIPIFEKIEATITVKDYKDSNDDSVSLYDKDGNNLTNAKKINGTYTFSPITYTKPGTYEYTIMKDKKERSRSITEDDSINVLVNVEYDASKNILSSTVDYDKEGFVAMPLASEVEIKACEKIDGVYYDNNKEETTEENFQKVCGVVENPQTGAFLPLYFLPLTILGIILIGRYQKKKFFKL